MDVNGFVLSHVPPPPARLLEIGCGAGDLALALANAGHDVTAIDPQGPAGAIFRRVTLEDFDATGTFDAVVASCSLHHVHDLGAAVDKIAGLAPLLVFEEFAWDLLDEPTADWYYGQLRALAAAGRRDEAPLSFEDCRRDWAEEHGGLHGFDSLRAQFGRRFEERFFEWRPYLHRLLRGVVGEELERTLIDAGAIRALGFRYVGARDSSPARAAASGGSGSTAPASGAAPRPTSSRSPSAAGQRPLGEQVARSSSTSRPFQQG